MMQVRQGDVLLIYRRRLPAGLVPIPRDAEGRIVLAHGEATGHAHVIREETAEFFTHPKNARRYLRLVKPAQLDREEHTPIELPSAFPEVVGQREYHPDELRPVID